MVVLGGVTRLTSSGLSMVDWDPLMGIVPPLNESEWQQTFDRYKQFPEYKHVNKGMPLWEFKEIFYVEYAHRVLGRLIGIAFLLPFLFFLFTRSIPPGVTTKLLAMFLLGGLQGLLGWYMVKSGLVDVPHVSAYRLAAHLLLAVVIYMYMFWVALGLLNSRQVAVAGWLRKAVYATVILVLVMIASGGFVAGTKAGFAFNTFPLMHGKWVPDGMWVLDPAWRNLFENIPTVQFIHRHIAYLIILAVLFIWFWMMRKTVAVSLRSRAHILVLVLATQVTLGITTLLNVVPIPLAAAHQAGALLLLTAGVWLLHGFRRGGAMFIR